MNLGNRHIARFALLATIGSGCDDDPEAIDRACSTLDAGETCTWVGLKGEEGFNGDGLHRRSTIVNQPQDLLFMPDGTAWFTDFNNFLIRRILADDTVETMVGSVDPLFPGDGPFGGVPPEGGPGDEWLLNHPTTLLLRPDGSILVVAWHNHKLLGLDAQTGFVTVIGGAGAGFAGDGQPVGRTTLFRQVTDATMDEQGVVYVIDQGNQRIRQIDTAGMITTISGTGEVGMAGDGGPATAAQFSFAAGSNPNPSGSLVHHQGKIYVSDTERDMIRVIDLATGTIDRFAGTGEAGGAGDDGPAIAAQFNGPRDLEIGPDGHLYIVDTDNSRVRAIDLETGIIRTVVGTGELGLDEEEGLPATEIKLRRPFGISFDPDGNLYVMDSLNSRIVKVAR